MIGCSLKESSMHTIKALAACSLLVLPVLTWADSLRLYSPTVQAGGHLSEKHVFNGFGCTGKNISPELVWEGAPKQARSFALTVYDPDAPTGSGWWHWVVLNIPASVSRLNEGVGTADGASMPAGSLQVRTDYGMPGFGGACPPAGDKPHRYIFTVYALKTDKIDLPDNATAALAGYMIHSNVLAKASFTALYGR
jgi:Raf kinase inhibitor-like YbhB/YbcL family protein